MNVKKFVVVMKKYSRKLLYVYSSEHSQREGISIVYLLSRNDAVFSK